MNAQGRSWMRKAMRLFGSGVSPQIATDELFAVRPGAQVAPVLAYGPSGPLGTGPQDEQPSKPYRVDNGIALIPIVGVLSRHVSLYRMFGCSDQPTLGEMGAAVRAAAADPDVAGIMLYVDSVGGTVAGTPDVAAEVLAAREAKPVHAYVDSIAASAAYWIAAQAQNITAGRVAEVGCIGVFAVLVDASKAAEGVGLRFHVVRSGAYKAAGMVPEEGISSEHLAYLQQRIDDSAAVFVADFAAGRGITPQAAEALADGRAYIASRALSVGLIDAVGTYEDAIAALVAAIESPQPTRPAAPPPPPESESPGDPTTPPESPVDEEASMSVKTKPEASGANAGAAEEGTIRRFLAKALGFTGPLAAMEPAKEDDEGAKECPTCKGSGWVTESDEEEGAKEEKEGDGEEKDEKAANAKSPALAQIQAATARLSALMVDADLKAFDGRATPATIAKVRPRLLSAKADGRDEDYAALLEGLAAQDDSGLLTGEIAGESQTSGVRVASERQARLADAGITPEREAELRRRYQIQ